MPVKTMGMLVLGLAVAILAFGLYSRWKNPMRVVSTGSVNVEDGKAGRVLVLRTRVVEVGVVTTGEVELPNGTWIDCKGDCADTVRREHLEFWDQPERRN